MILTQSDLGERIEGDDKAAPRCDWCATRFTRMYYGQHAGKPGLYCALCVNNLNSPVR